MRAHDRLTWITLDHHPLDVIGWDGHYDPYAFSIHDGWSLDSSRGRTEVYCGQERALLPATLRPGEGQGQELAATA